MSSLKPVIRYKLNVDSISQHLFSVIMDIPALNEKALDVTLPAWIPGSYMIRDFARHIVEIDAFDQHHASLSIVKKDKQTWSIDNASKGPVTLKYKVFAFDLSVRSAFINDEYAFCNGTSVFFNVNHEKHFGYQLEVDTQHLPENWALHTSMPQSTEASENAQFACDDYLEFIDHPIFIGKCRTAFFTSGGVEFTLLFSGNDPIDIDRICEDLKPICLHHIKMFDDEPPVSTYLFITLLSDKGYGGLEHLNSTALLFPRFDLPLMGEDKTNQNSYINFLSLCSHEFFHTWNVKRIKPDVMHNPDLLTEVYTNQLWMYEGFTSFYDELAVARAGIISSEKYIALLGENITRVMQSEGRMKQSVAESSFDAWTRFYKQDASSTNHIVSYYVKGGLIALGLDLLLRQQSNNQYCLDDLMRLLWQQHGKSGIGTLDEVVQQLCQQEFDIDVCDYIQDVVHGTQDVPLNKLLHVAGMSLHQRNRVNKEDKGGSAIEKPLLTKELGLIVKNSECGVIVQQIKENLAGCKAGLQINDRIVALDGYEVNDNLLQRLIETTSAHTLPMTFIRDGRLLTTSLPIVAAQKDTYYLKINDQLQFENWLNKI